MLLPALLTSPALLLLLASPPRPAQGAKRSAYYPLYSVPTPYFYNDPSQYYVPTSASQVAEQPLYNYLPYSPVPPLTAVVDIKNYGGNEVTGRLMLTQVPGGPVILQGNITGLSQGAHGFHVHEFGDLSKGCDSLGAHFNPTLSHHGGPADPYRHVGDLGNIMADAEGKARLADSDHLISLTGPHSVVGRGLVIHEGKDDFGRGGDKESLRTGNSGARVACGVISWAAPPAWVPRGPGGVPLPGGGGPGMMEGGNGGPQPTEPQAEQIEP